MHHRICENALIMNIKNILGHGYISILKLLAIPYQLKLFLQLFTLILYCKNILISVCLYLFPYPLIVLFCLKLCYNCTEKTNLLIICIDALIVHTEHVFVLCIVFCGRFSRVARTEIGIPWNSILTLPKNCFTFNWKVRIHEETLRLNNLSKCLIYVILSNVNVPGWFKVKLYQGW